MPVRQQIHSLSRLRQNLPRSAAVRRLLLVCFRQLRWRWITHRGEAANLHPVLSIEDSHMFRQTRIFLGQIDSYTCSFKASQPKQPPIVTVSMDKLQTSSNRQCWAWGGEILLGSFNMKFSHQPYLTSLIYKWQGIFSEGHFQRHLEGCYK